MFALKPRIEIAVRVLLIAVILLNALAPTVAFARSEQASTSPSAKESDLNSPRSLSEQKPIYFDPPEIAYPQQTSPQSEDPESSVPPKNPVEISLIAEPAIVPANGLVKLNVHIRNHSEQALTSLIFTDSLEAGLEYSPDNTSLVTFDPQKKEVSLTIPSIRAGEDFAFSYSLTITSPKRNEIKGKIWLHNSELVSSTSNLKLNTSAALGVDLPVGTAQSELTPLQSNGDWNALGRTSHSGLWWLGVLAVLLALCLVLRERRGLFFMAVIPVAFLPVLFLVIHRVPFFWSIPFLGVAGLAAVLFDRTQAAMDRRFSLRYGWLAGLR